ncbi:MAG: cell division protein ZapB, partial [Alphaproteobacteria bacterium]
GQGADRRRVRMHLGRSDHARRSRRRRVRARVVKISFFVGVIAVASAWSYWRGMENAERPTVELERTIDRLREENARLEQTTAELGVAIEAARKKTRAAQERYEREVPDDAIRTLLAQVRRKLGEGVPAERLAFVIGAAENTRSCDEKPVTKRFIVSTPLYDGPNSAVTFADNAFTVTGVGTSARDQDGNPEAWFDPAEAVTIRFTHIGGRTFEVSGRLPLHHSIVVGEIEHRFSMTQGPRGFLHVAGDSCQYP